MDAFWGPSVHSNGYLGLYVMLLNRTAGTNWWQEGIYIVLSNDLVRWSEPQGLFEAEDWYPQVMGLGPRGTDSHAGRLARLYVGGVSAHVIEFTAVGQPQERRNPLER